MAKTRWDIEIGYTTNTSGLKSLEANFLRLQSLAKEPGNALDTGLQNAAKDANVLLSALKKCYNADIGSLNVVKFSNELKNSGRSLSEYQASLKQLAMQEGEVGAAGQKAFNNLGSAILGTNLYIKESNKLLDNFARTFSNTIKYNISGGIYREVVGSVSKAISYTQHLDTSLNDIRIVTDKSADSMAKFAKEANSAAKAIGASTLDYTEASLIFYQQGLDDAETKARTEATLKAANVTGQSGSEVSEQLTAVWNGYKVSAAETELYVDKLAAVAATTAADLEELSTGMSKVASAANAMGIDVDQLNAQLATIVSVTRQAPESVGTALKTIYARMSTIEAGGEDEGTTLKNYTETMAKFGISVLDGQNKLRDMGDVMEEVGNKWSTMSREQQVALAQAMAGTRQYNNLLALFENWDMYNDAVETSANAMGTLQHQQDIYLESTEAHLQQMRTAAQGLYDTMVDNTTVNAGIDIMTDFIDVVNKSFESFGGGFKSIILMGTTIATLFSDQIGKGLANMSAEAQKFRDNFVAIQEKSLQLEKGLAEGTNTTTTAKSSAAYYKVMNEEVGTLEKMREGGSISTQQYNEVLNKIKEKASLEEQVTLTLERQKHVIQNIGDQEELQKDSYQGLIDILDDETYSFDKIQNKYDEIGKIVCKTREEEQEKERAYQAEIEKLERINKELEEEKRKTEELKELNSLLKEDATFRDLGEGSLSSKDKQRKEDLTRKYNAPSHSPIGYGMVNAADDLKAQQAIEESKRAQLESQQEAVKAAQIEHADALERNAVEHARLDMIEKNYEVALEIENVKEQEARITQQIKDAEREAVVQQMESTSLMNLSLGAIGSLSSGWLSVSNTMRIVNDDSTSFGQKMAQIGMTMSMTLPMMITSISKLSKGYKTLTNAENLAAVAESVYSREQLEAARNTGKRVSVEETKLFIQQKGVRQTVLAIASEEGYAKALEKTRKALWENVKAKRANVAADTKTAFSKKGTGISSAVMQGFGIEEGIAQLAGPLVTAAIVAAITLAIGKAIDTALVSANGKILDKWENKANIYKQNRQAAEEEAESAHNLHNAYVELFNDTETSGLEKEKLKNKVYNLCLQYGEEELAIKSLNMSYQELNKTINDLESTSREKAITNGTEEMLARKAMLMNQSRNISTFNGDFFDTVFSGGERVTDGVANSDWIAFQDEKSYARNLANALGLESNAFIDGNGKVSMKVSDYIDDMAKNKDAFVEALNAEGGGDFAKELKIIVDQQFLNNLDAYSEAYNSVQEQTQQQIVSGFSDGAYDSFDKFAIAFQEGIQKLEAAGVEDSRQWLMNELSGDSFGDEVTSYLQSISLANILVGDKDNFEEVAKMISAFSKEEREYMSANPWLFAGLTEQEIKEKLKTLSGVVERNTSIKDAAKIAAIVELVDKDGNVFTKETIEKIFDKDSGINLRVNKDEFSKLSDADKLAELNFAQFSDVMNANSADMTASREILEADRAAYTGENGFSKYIEAFESDNELLKKYTEAEQEAFTDEAIQRGIESTTGYIQEQAAALGVSVDEYKDLAKNIEEYNKLAEKISNGDDYTKEEENRYFELGQKYTELTMQQKEGLVAAQQIVQNDEVYKAFEDAREGYANLITDIESSIASLDEQMYSPELFNRIQQDLKDYSSEMDGLQNSYKSLTDIVKDYNDNQHLTLDNLQSLLSMEPEYLACLEMEDGQMKINQEAMQYLLQTQLENAKATIYEQQALRIKGILEKDGVQVSAMYQAAEAATAATVEGSVSSYMKAAAALDFYNQVKAQGEEASEEAQAAINETIRQTDMLIQSIDSIDVSNLKSTLGSSSGSSKKDKELKKLDDEFDRYWELNKAISEVTHSLEQLDKAQSNLHGKELIRSLQEENKLLDKQKEKYEALYHEQVKEAGELQGKLNNFGVIFGADGAITNYAQATQNALQQFNDAVAAYNAGTLSDEAYDAAEKTYEAFKNALGRYDTLFYDEMVQTQDKLDDIWRAELANNLQAWSTEVEIQLDLSEAERQWNEFLRNINNDFKAEYKDISVDMQGYLDDALTYSGATGTINTRIGAISDVEREIDKMMSGQSSDMFESVSQAQEKLKELKSQLEDDTMTLHSLWEKAWNDYLSAIDQGDKKLDDLMNKFKQIDNELEFQGQLIELLYGEKAYDLMNKLYGAQSKNSLAQVDSVKQQRDMWKKLYDEAEEGNADKAKYYDLWIEAQNELNDLVVEHIELLKKDYLNTINDIVNTVKTNTVGGNLDYAKQQWKDKKAIEEGYYDDTERIYQIETMQNKWLQLIADAPVEKQQKLTELMNEQIDGLKDKIRLSEYDIGLAERELQIEQARLDLENARENKNSMKVTRGTDGNWSYQYVADEEDVASKQQALLDAINDKYEYIKQKNQETLEDLLTNTEKYWERYYEILEDTTLKDEEREARLQELWDTYYGEEGLITAGAAAAEQTKQDLNQATYELLWESYSQDEALYETMTENEKALIDGLKEGTIQSREEIQEVTQAINDESLEAWQTMARDMADAWNADDGESIKSQVLSAMAECEDALRDYESELDYLAAIADMDFSETGVTGAINQAEDATDSLTDATEILVQAIESDLASCISVINDIEYAWDDVRYSVENAIRVLDDYLKLLGEAITRQKELISMDASGIDGLINKSGSGSGSGSGAKNKTTTINGDFTYWSTDSKGNILYRNSKTGQVVSKNQISDNSTYGTKTDYLNFGNTTTQSKSQVNNDTPFTYMTDSSVKVKQERHGYTDWYGNIVYVDNAKTTQDVIDAIRKKYGMAVEYSTDDFLKKDFAVFKSGGYTGAWGADGRLAMLHEKELVLNAADTRNILSVVDTVRDLSGLGSSISSVIAEGLASTLAKLAGINSSSVSYATNSVTNDNQNNTYNITLECGDRDITEMKNMILSLPNAVSQYVNEKHK